MKEERDKRRRDERKRKNLRETRALSDDARSEPSRAEIRRDVSHRKDREVRKGEKEGQKHKTNRQTHQLPAPEKKKKKIG